MPYNVLLLPLLGGYIFVALWNVTRFYCRREGGQRLIFWSAIAGFIFLAISYVVTQSLPAIWPGLHRAWTDFAGYPHLGKSLGAFLLGATLWIPLNLVFRKKQWAERTARNWGDYLELLLQRSIRQQKMVSITLKSGKVYIGMASATHNPSYDKRYIKLLPVLSGHRDSATHQLEIDTQYEAAYKKMQDEIPAPFNEDDFELVIAVGEIQTVSIFILDVYRFFNPGSK
jgi:hypothetical protein